jgi:3-methyladenine DNA glycosylase AlkD
MTFDEAIQQLKELGTEQNRKIYRRHGVGENMYGVSVASLKALQKKIKVDHALAQKLWATGNHDARVLATMVADPKAMDERTLDAWAKDLSNYVIADAFSALVGRTSLTRQAMERWTGSDSEWIGQAGWNLLAHLAMKDGELSDGYFEGYLSIIECEIHSRKNRTRYAMNSALIAIGIRNGELEQKALAVAERIGEVDVDHGETNCETPDAAAYIRKTWERKGRQRVATIGV